jgi:hypothetical protein
MDTKEFDTLLVLYNNMHGEIRDIRKEISTLDKKVDKIHVDFTEQLTVLDSNHKERKKNEDRFFKLKIVILSGFAGSLGGIISNIDVILKLIIG